MLIIPGGDALSAHQNARMLQRLQAILPACLSVDARYLHFVECDNELDSSQLATLNRLLHYGEFPRDDDDDAPSNFTRVVTPRIGTISPWSSKATDILHHCGLTMVTRVERGVEWRVDCGDAVAAAEELLPPLLHDAMTESVLPERESAQQLFRHTEPQPLTTIDILGGGIAALEAADVAFGFALSATEREYLTAQFTRLKRNPTDVELMMFAQVNSEHCRHKIFNADWRLDGREQTQSLFAMIRETHAQNPSGTLVAYNDNAAVIAGYEAARLQPDPRSRVYGYRREAAHLVAKVETHNHPTAIAPFAGAATGAGGEIRDEGATGRGGKPKAGMVGYTVSHLRLPGCERAWEGDENRPLRIASPLQIMLDAPLGAASFNNEFGRPNIAGYFRTFEQIPRDGDGDFRYAYHKPIMIAGGVGNIRPPQVRKKIISDGAPIVVIGGPVMLIGLGGGAASSVASGAQSEALDFASVQRGNAEMQRRCQEVIDACCVLGDDNPILSIHDVGAGGLCNALPELVHDSARGGAFGLREILNDERGMSPLQIWCNESQERYVLAIAPEKISEFEAICKRERCLYATVGHAVADDAQKLTLSDKHFADDGAPFATPIDLPMDLLFGLPPKMERDVVTVKKNLAPLNLGGVTVQQAARLVLSFPAVADKSFLITIGDRSVGGLVARDQMVGRWQVPVADVGVVAGGFCDDSGEAIAVGERTPLSVINAAASARMAVGEAITNIAAASVGAIGNIKLSANWMVAAGEPGHDADLFAAVRAAAGLCPQLGVAIPVGKDSMSMKSAWRDAAGRDCQSVSPVSPVVTAFAPVDDVGATLTPCIKHDDNELWLLDLGRGRNRLGGSALAQVTAQMGDDTPDVNEPNLLKNFFAFIQSLLQKRLIRAYHDRADGGVFATLCEMAFASRCGLSIDFGAINDDALAVLFNEELGAVIQTDAADHAQVINEIHRYDLTSVAQVIGTATAGDEIEIRAGDATCLRADRVDLHRVWSETSYRMQALRDNPKCADEEYARIDDRQDPGLFSRLTFDHKTDITAPYINRNSRPKIAILREQGVNGQAEMAAAFDRAGFAAVDVTMSDLLAQSARLDDYKGVAACGGFSFGDVLGGGEGWAKSILHNARLRDEFAAFFKRSDTFALGVCNGCQMMAAIKELIPGASHWPKFIRNQSEQFEARVVMLEICSDKSILLREMRGACLPVSTAHGEGRAQFAAADLAHLTAQQQVVARFIDNHANPTETYPANPNGSPAGATAFTNHDGRFTILMPHPERVFRAISNSWHEKSWGEYGPWIQLFRNARVWVD